jgi:AcrR family transcriptional regulator
MNSQRRRRLLETAAREFADTGYEQASLNKIIRTCNMSKSSFYHYFTSKADLFDTVVREAAQALERELAIPDPRELAGPHFWEDIARLAGDLLALSDPQNWYVDFGKLFYLPDAPFEHSRELQAVKARITSWLDQALTVGREYGVVRDDLPRSLQAELAFAVLQAMDRWSLHHLHEITPDTHTDIARTQLDTVRRLLAP